jgi:hypothetical protein
MLQVAPTECSIFGEAAMLCSICHQAFNLDRGQLLIAGHLLL